jgi:uncharacterized membrane protein
MKYLKFILKLLVLFLIGGVIYYGIECIWRGFSHWTMAILGGICFIAIGSINEFFTWEMPLWKQCLIGSIIVTILEFITGCIVNLWLGWNVWHYEYFDILGQVCLPFSLIWMVLSGIAIIVDDWLRYWFFNEEKPRYKIK